MGGGQRGARNVRRKRLHRLNASMIKQYVTPQNEYQSSTVTHPNHLDSSDHERFRPEKQYTDLRESISTIEVANTQT